MLNLICKVAVSKVADNRAESLVAVSKVADNRAESLVAVSKGVDNRAESLVAVSKVVDNRAENLVAVSKVVDNRAAVDNKAGEAAKKNKVDGNNYRNEAVAVPDNSRQSTPVACDEPLKELSRLSTKLQTDPS